MSDFNLEQARTADGVRMTDERMREVFDLVASPKGWKEPINARVPKLAATQAELETAVAWFAGGYPDVLDRGDRWYVTGAGYYAWVGA